MIVNLKGVLIAQSPSEIVIDVQGVGYLCHISNNTYSNLPNINNHIYSPT